MPHIIPIRDLKDTNAISRLCHEAGEPVFVTKNGYGDMVIMSMERFQKAAFLDEVYGKLAEAETQAAEGKTLNAQKSLKKIREKHHV